MSKEAPQTIHRRESDGHYAHYLHRKVAIVPYINQEAEAFRKKPNPQAFARPIFHATKSESRPSSEIEPGNTIWVFSQLGSPWKPLPPSLCFKLVVSKVEKRRGGGYSYEAGIGSRWFPLYDCLSTLRKLSSVNVRGETVKLLKRPSHHVGQALQSIRRLADPAALNALVEQMDALGSEFISYRLIDGTFAAHSLARDFMERGLPVFWDRWSLPRGLAERRESFPDKALDAHIFALMRQAKGIHAIHTPRYAEQGSYSAREWNYARSLGKLTSHEVRK